MRPPCPTGRVATFSPRLGLSLVALLLVPALVGAPERLAAQAPARADSVPAAAPADVATPDAILAALYDVISGPAGVKLDWNRFRSLLLPGARLIPTGMRPDGQAVARVLTPEDYILSSGSRIEQAGFYEREIARREERYGNVLHAFSAYESKHTKDDPTPFARGINSIQLFNDGKRWWVATIMWDSERASNPMPSWARD
jgi:hypothetical protein